MKISELDRAEALIRMPEYLKDLNSPNRHTLKSSIEFKRKYRLLKIVTPGLVEAIKELPEQRRELELKRLFIKPHRYINFKMDLNISKKENIMLLSRVYDNHQAVISLMKKELKVKRERKRELSYDAWLVYDMCHKENMTYTQVAKQLSGEKGYPSGNEKLMAAYKAVERADKRAKKIIEQTMIFTQVAAYNTDKMAKEIMNTLRSE